MTASNENAELLRWLRRDDVKSRPYRVQRAKEIIASMNFPVNGFLFFGGMKSSYSFEEARLAYINGLYIGTVILTLVMVEHELAATLYASGVDKAAKITLEEILKMSLEANLITEEESTTFNKLRNIRNSYSHFRPVSHPTNLARRAMDTDTEAHVILESDALDAIKALASLAQRRAVH